jgi:FAD/FMN-containing dehydrogenase/Fe-S oxidoreductase
MERTPPPAESLARELRAGTAAEIRFDNGDRAAYSTDASNYRHIPIGVVLPRTVEDIVATVAICRRHNVPITTRGGGTSLAGQACNVAVIIDCSKYFNRVLALDPGEGTATVEAGCVLDVLRQATLPHGLTFGPDPATHSRCTLGGMIGNNACGVHSVMSQFYGPGPLTRHQVIELDILTYQGARFTVSATSATELAAIVAAGGQRGAIYAALAELRDDHAERIRAGFVDIPRRVSGYNLDALLPEQGFNVAHALVGTEGTCAVVLHAKVQLIDAMPERKLLVLGYPDAFVAADQVPLIMRHRPVGLEGMDAKLIEGMRRRGIHPAQVAMLPPGGGWLMVEFGGSSAGEVDAQARAMMDVLRQQADVPTMRLCETAAETRALWEVREASLGVTAIRPDGREAHEGWEDSAVAPERLGGYLRAFCALLDEFGYSSALYGHFGQGCVHCRIDFDLRTTAGVEKWMRFLDRAATLVVAHGGSISGEHGDGQAKAMFLSRMYGDELVEAFRRFKWIWDPDHCLNPGKVVEPRRADQDLRGGPDYAPRAVTTQFAFGHDRGSFAQATARCVGVGACRQTDHGTMCPSYMVTREEVHSTRGRARLLYEMMDGHGALPGGWDNRAVHDALDLCLGCKACKHECPVSVDMATYKAEFLSHHFAKRWRPRQAHAMGRIYWWARALSPIASVANRLAQGAPFEGWLKQMAGIAPQRRIPSLAQKTFRHWFAQRTPRPGSRGTVMLWPDTFSNYFRPDAARASVAVLEHAGYTVAIPRRPLCCGRPLYDWGMLDQAKALWRQTLAVLEREIRDGIPIVGVEPSCVASFRDELPGLFPGRVDAQRLASQVVTLAELLERDSYVPVQLPRQAIVHVHCHQQAVLGASSDSVVLKRAGVAHTVLDSGCCGMAGAFGFDRDKYPISMAAGERVLLPAVRAADAGTLVIANGFSCQEQILQGSARQPVHLAQVLAQGFTSERQ